MSHGSRETLEKELDALLRQRDQYSLALDAATDPQASIRLQRTLERLEDEVEGLREALAALPGDGAHAAVPPPDWEEEPETAIFDPDLIPGPTRSAPEREAITQPVAVVPPRADDPARPLYDLDQELERARKTGLAPKVATHPVAWQPPRVMAAEPGAAEPLPAVDPTINVTPPVDPIPEVSPAPVLARRRTPAPSFAADPPTVLHRRRPSPDPLGPVVLDALEPPTGEQPKDEDEPPSDPFALPGARWGTQPAMNDWGGSSTATPVDDSSPFGSTAIGGAAFDASSVPDVAPEAEWSAGSKIALALVVVGFLAGVGWVLTQ